MFENIIRQEASSLLENDIRSSSLPGALLFYGPASSGKLSCALECARVLSCTGEEKGAWQCTCPSCLRHKALVHQNTILAGPRDCTLEIASCLAVFLSAHKKSTPYERSARYLFLRSVRKLTMRFNPVVLQDDDKLSKIAPLIASVDEYMETLDFPHELPDAETLEKTCGEIQKLCRKLESDFLPDAIPIKHIRAVSAWAHIKSSEGKKTVVLENAERMNESARNALLKILEEPPEDAVFILTTEKRSSVMPTILSRVRPYRFRDRTKAEQLEVVRRIFHDDAWNGTLGEYFETFLPVAPEKIRDCAASFFKSVASNAIPDCAKILKDCASFEPRLMFRIFLDGIARVQRPLAKSASGAESSAECMASLRECWLSLSVYNESPLAALENLTRTFFKINKTHDFVFKAAYE